VQLRSGATRRSRRQQPVIYRIERASLPFTLARLGGLIPPRVHPGDRTNLPSALFLQMPIIFAVFKECNVTLEDSGKLDDVIGRLEGDGDGEEGDGEAAAELGEIKKLTKANGVKLDLVASLWYTALFMCGGLGIDVNKRSVREDPAHRHVLVQLKMALLEMDAWREGEDEAVINSLFEAATQESNNMADTLSTAQKLPITLQLKMEPEMEDDEDDDDS
jgi:hypothetical protein